MGVGLKKVIVELLQKGYSLMKISEMLNVPKLNVIDVCRKFSETGSVEHKPRGGWPKQIKPQDYRQLERIVKTQIVQVCCPILLPNLMRGDLIP